MFGSLMMLGSSNNKCKKFSMLFSIVWVLYIVLIQFGKTAWYFPLINIGLFLGITYCIRRINNKYANTFFSIISILLWSIAIDTVCYFAFPLFAIRVGFIDYILAGIMFNYKNIMVNCICVALVKLIDTVLKSVKHLEFVTINK